MASAGSNNGPGRPQRPPLRLVRIPLTRLQAGQRVMLRLVPGQAAGRGNPGVHPHIHVVGLQPDPTHHPNPPQPQDNINRAVQQQEEELQRRAEEEHRRREQLKSTLTPPQPPQITHNPEEGTAELSWQPVGPASSGDDWQPVYCVMMSEGNRDPHEMYRGHMTCCTISCDLLCPGHTYHFTVTATANGERGEPSGCSLVVPALPPSPPLPPRVASRAKTSLTLRWSAPSKDNGSAITLYSLEWDQCGRGYVELYSGKGKQFKFNNRFPPGSHTLFRLRAQNEVGWSTYSDPLEFSAGAGPPSTPHPPTLTQAGVHHLTLQWTAPADSGSPITAFCLEMEDRGSGYGFCPVFQGEELYFTCSSLQRSTGYNFRLSAANDRGISSTSHPITYHTLPDVPGQPPGPTLKDRPHSTSLNIAWRPPEDDGGSKIHSYQLQLDDGLGGPLSSVYQGLDTSYLAEGLSPGQTYQCRVCACSEGGQGAWSSLSQFHTPPTPPHPPRALRLSSRPTQTSVTLEWDRPESSGGAAITSYSLDVRQVREGAWQTAGTVADPHTFLDQGLSPVYPPPITYVIDRLLPGKDYEFQVTCRNSVGTSDPSLPLPCIMAPGPADPPTELEVASRTASSAQLRWQASLEHGCRVTSYLLEFTPVGVERQVVSTDSLCSHTLRNLLPATSYTIRLKAVSKAGHSEWTPPTLFTTTPSTPAQPPHFSLVSCAHTSLLVGWAVPQSNGAPVTSYCIEVVSGHMTSHKILVNAMETQQLLDNLHPSTSYRLRVQAENEMGKGPFSPYISACTLHPPPPPPSLALLSYTTQSLKVGWGRKLHKDTEYLLQMAQQGRGFRTVYQGSATTHKAARLQPATEYTFRAAAISESGQGAWSDHLTFKTLPTPPLAPKELVLRQVSDQELLLSWSAVDYPLPLSYEVQVRTARPEHDFQQAYKGMACSCSLEVKSYDLPHEVRVRAMASCDVNDREEVLWGAFAQPVHCLCEKLEKDIVSEPDEEPGGPSPPPPEEDVAEGLDQKRRVLGFLVLVLMSLLVLVLAFLMGQYAV